MADYGLRYVGADCLPGRLTEFDLQQNFRLSISDVEAIKTQFRSDHRAGVAVLLLFLRAAGRPLDRISVLPRVLLRYVAEKLQVDAPSIATLRSIYKRRPTHYEHQAWVKKYLGLNEVDQAVSDLLATYLTAQANEVVSVDELVTAACRWLHERKILIPSDRQVRDLARQCFVRVEAEILKTIRACIAPESLARCQSIIRAKYGDSSASILEWLKTPPRRHSPTSLAETLDKIKYLKGLGAHEWPLQAIPLEKQRGYAQAVQARRPVMTSKLRESTQAIELVFFLRITLLELTDSVIYQAGRRVSDLVRRAYDKTQARQARSSAEYRDRLVSIKTLVDDIGRSAEVRLAAIGELVSDMGLPSASSHAANVRQVLTDEPSRIRALLSSLQDLDFKGRPNDNSLKLLASLKEIYAAKLNELPQDQAFPVDKPWRDLVSDPDRRRALKAMEACAMVGLRKGLRRGSVWIDHSFSYRERDQMLIPPADWASDRERHLSILGLPAEADVFLEPLLKNIQAGLAAVAEAKQQGKLTIDVQGMLHLPVPQALPEEIDPKRTRDLMFKEIGDVQFPDLLLEMDAQTNFSEILLARRARDERELVALYAALIAHGTEIDAKSVAAMTPQLDPDLVSVAMRALEASGRLRRANERVVEFQGKHAIAELWGSGKTASSDMMSLDASKHLYNARIDPRRRTHAVGLYTHVLDQHGIIYDQPIVLNERQAGAAIEGVVRYNDSNERVRLSLLAVDTHGYTNVGMAVAKGLGFDLCPRLRDLSERKLYLPRSLEAPEGLDQVLVRDVSLKAIRAGWDEYLRMVASVRSGRVSANVLMHRFGSAAHGDPAHRAVDQLGRLLRTLFLCDYFSNPEFRREIHTILNRGESVHQLQRAVYYGKVPPERGRRRDEMVAISGSHTLLTNLVLAWNTHHMQETAERWRRAGQQIEDAWLARMGPAHFAHVNFRGTFKFGISRYAEMLLSQASTGAKRSA